jgi:aminoglycoside phosphotransferase (APT) family kinase protein
MMAPDPASIQNRLASVVSRHLGCEARVEHPRRLTGGAVAETWSFNAICEDRRYELILRAARRATRLDPHYPDKEAEARIQQVTIERGVPVPRVRFILEEGDGFGVGYVMDRVEGETLAPRILREDKYAGAREVMARQCGEILARIHTVNPPELPELAVFTNKDQVDHMESLYASFGQSHPVFDFTLRWLREHLPADVNPRLVHSDFRNGNFIVGPEGIRAVLDWEMAHFGDPMEDLGWICVNSWRFGHIDKQVGGFGELEDMVEGYEAAGGGVVDRRRVHFWEVFGTLKWGLICLIQAFTHLRGNVRSVELAAIGRRVSETEIDLVNLLM